ncbi:hypothetical protein GCM10010168_47010 [Actinoplanes ianthinogenes]|uniref:Uncharacterized protein n=1 Tax=Actinoplanes ianthinogenes TaxID=122358 RepID=A0ABM7LP65_9ACTN|nr:hypothetical protein Aiant_16570 [Actinoplanes ianthinogenes]GGR23616.1 hypothetical protein GCM10010168_47010 [Actinoplanes ianthinogenes]
MARTADGTGAAAAGDTATPCTIPIPPRNSRVPVTALILRMLIVTSPPVAMPSLRARHLKNVRRCFGTAAEQRFPRHFSETGSAFADTVRSPAEFRFPRSAGQTGRTSERGWAGGMRDRAAYWGAGF